MQRRWGLQSIAITTRLRVVFSAIVLLMLLGSILTFRQFRTVSGRATQVSRVEQRAGAVLRLHNALLTLMNQLHRSAAEQSTPRFASDARRLLEQFQVQSAATASTLRQIATQGERHAVLVGSILSMLENIPGRVNSFVRLADAGDWIALNGRLRNEADETDDVVGALMQQVDVDLATARSHLMTELEQAQQQAAHALMLTAALSLVVAAVLGALLTRSITKPLSSLDQAARALGEGNFTYRAEIRGRDELARLTQAFNNMADEIARLFEEVRREHATAETAQAELEERAKELARVNADLQQFAYSASHDLQEPLRVVIMYSQLLQRKYAAQLDASANEYMSYLSRAATQMEQLITDLLAYSRVAGSGRTDDAVTDADVLLKRVLKTFEARLREQHAEVHCAPLPKVRAHEIHVQQLLQNLLGNALRYRSEADPVIDVWSEADGDHWAFAVRDNGIGIAAPYREQVFGMFKRLHGQSYPGTGMGLAICKRIAEIYGGRIWVDSEPGKGSTFWFTLPRTPSDSAPPEVSP
jgi:signal transduction histidine kinase